MHKSMKKSHNRRESNSTFIQLNKQLAFLKNNKRKIDTDQDLYYDENQDRLDIELYYKSVAKQEEDGLSTFYRYSEFLNKTHKNRLPYFISKDLYLYTWVDLHPDGTVRSIYSGEAKSPESLIIHDFHVIREKYEEFQLFLKKIKQNEFETFKELKEFERNLKVNTEHIVPQSWFKALEPMKGDLHHLFVCEPVCNIARSNFPYGDFSDHQPHSAEDSLQNHCGVVVKGQFEPENGKGEAARAMLYFLLRYPKAIKKAFRSQIDLPLLIDWNLNYPVALYEKHRNQAIFQIQGNRNPFIDFPNLAKEIDFPFLSI
ncbi:endonuclease I family protein [Neobacillus massiliamazoniensis]|uniref:Extracellular ribonuclease n=1 Tax=Neobacillus massiliamazoniensis TaxID=1499688 RepID=A0A0U1P4W0_9BACI|nr:endonuclease [Neobacillus massiliamazoniensis]CRK85092.1 extracellular ribonuclease precursor [Neobacillus massiliamazoniensis]